MTFEAGVKLQNEVMKKLFCLLLCCLYLTVIQAQFPYIEIKNHRAEVAKFGQIILSEKRDYKKAEKFTVDLTRTDTFACQKTATALLHGIPPDDTTDILLYIHCMWGGQNFFANKVLRAFVPEIIAPGGRTDKIFSVIWHSGISYKKNIGKARISGKKLADNLGFIMQTVREESDLPVRFHLLTHSMGHQVLREILRRNADNPAFRFTEVIMAGADVPNDIFAVGEDYAELAACAERITLFVHERDFALKMSENMTDTRRLGRTPTDYPLPANVRVLNVTDSTEDTKGAGAKISRHVYFFKSKTVREITIGILNGKE